MYRRCLCVWMEQAQDFNPRGCCLCRIWNQNLKLIYFNLYDKLHLILKQTMLFSSTWPSTVVLIPKRNYTLANRRSATSSYWEGRLAWPGGVFCRKGQRQVTQTDKPFLSDIKFLLILSFSASHLWQCHILMVLSMFVWYCLLSGLKKKANRLSIKKRFWKQMSTVIEGHIQIKVLYELLSLWIKHIDR